MVQESRSVTSEAATEAEAIISWWAGPRFVYDTIALTQLNLKLKLIQISNLSQR